MKGMRSLMVNMDAPHLQLGDLGKHLPVLAIDLRRRRHGVDLLGNAGSTVGEMPESAGSGRVITAINGYQCPQEEARLGVFLPRLGAGPYASLPLTHKLHSRTATLDGLSDLGTLFSCCL